MIALCSYVLAAWAASSDPDLKWRTITTEHFDIHFHQGIEQVADEFSATVEDVYGTMTDELAWTPHGRTQVVLIDRTDDANGFASAVPYPQITIYVTAPTAGSTLQLYEDWDQAIFTHEFTHVLHMDTNHGIVRAARLVVGRIASTNSLSPGWMIEGLATFQETRHTAGGRGRASFPDMIKRTAVVEDDFPPLGNLDGFQPDPPSGNLRYLFGQDFIQYVADQQGADVWTKWIHTYGGWVPFWLPTRRAFGRQLVPLYQDWKDASFAKYTAQAEAIRAEAPITTGRLVSDPAASCVAPAYAPDGEKLVWSCYDLRLGSAIWLADGDGYAPVKLTQNNGAAYFTWRADSRAFVYAAAHIVNQFNVWSDIYLYTGVETPGHGSTAVLTNGARARDPDFSPDGSRLVYVVNDAQNNQLESMTVDRRQRELTDNTDHTQYSTPRFSPDGKWLALSVWREGNRDLWLYDPDGHPVRRLTMDVAIDTDPTWSPDGKWLFFDSDRSGVPNVYAIELATERLWQVTNVVTGAIKPTIHPDGHQFAFMQYSADGWDVYVAPLDPTTFRDRGLLPRPIEHGAPIPAIGPSTRPPDDDDATASIEPWAPPDGRAPSGVASGQDPAARGVGPAARALRPVTPFDALGRPLAPGWLPIADVPRGHPQQTEAIDNFGDTTVEDAFGEEKDYPFRITPHRYNPLPTLRPRYLLPVIQTTPYVPRTLDFTCPDPAFCFGLQGTLATGGVDALSRYGWGGTLSYRTDADALQGSFGLTINRFLPVYSFGVSTAAVATTTLAFVADPPTTADGGLAVVTTEPPTYYWDRRTTAFATVSWPYRLRTTAFAQYSFGDRRPRFELPSNVYEPSVPFVGYIGAVSGGWRYAWSEPTAYAISAEDGEVFSLVGTLRAPWLGSFTRDRDTDALEPLTQLQLTSEIRKYWTNPWLANHVLAVRAAAGVTFGQNEFFGNYLLGGSIGDSAFLATPDEFRMIRGYPFGADVGDLYWLGSAEYRLPLLRIERGVGTVPLYGRTLAGAVFVDAGNAFVSPSLETGIPPTALDLLDAAVTDPLVGVGAEVTFRAVIGWGV
ncbi:MAG: hypothetical protein ABMB14_10695, partial [Myxococcota bacterium]